MSLGDLVSLADLAVYTAVVAVAETAVAVAAAVVAPRKPMVAHHHAYKQLTTASNRHKFQFFLKTQYIQVKKEEFLAFVPELLHCESRKDFARYVRAKDQLIGWPPSV
jgi:hypothetical protein